MPYDQKKESPEFKIEKDGTVTYTHNHAQQYRYLYDELSLQTRKDARAFMERGKREVNRCSLFMQHCLKDEKLTPIQKAALQQLIKSDEDLVKELDDAKPLCCTIL